MPLNFFEQQQQRNAGEGENGNQAEVIRVGQQGGLLLHAAIEHAQSLLMRGHHIRALRKEAALQAARHACRPWDCPRPASAARIL